MDFFLVGVLLWLLIVAYCLLFTWGLIKSNWKILLLSGIIILVPAMIFSTADGLVKLLFVLPLIAFSLSYYFYKRTKRE
ncbi:hypothetical protein IMZ08_17355 [Bacillus luteolus]|uniref:Uncharacterized protein n=1 Tax=Litchfieldia luteola TaxID=682179 RepID=A0ABR9QMX7_9BACI|nr:hypothetical protein [Cytobacillus luteolus]MBE4909804.1 hypothetical protein [Cytobacillus luteolus]MBP1942649.1 hypothetical protein [Cytobacillus luteolus]